MNTMNPDNIEQLIGKSLDSEITPAEKQLLDCLVEKHPELKARIGELGQLSDAARQILHQDIVEKGDCFADVFSRALQNRPSKPYHKRIRLHPAVHVAATLAAGFLLGLVAYGLFDTWQTKSETPVVNSPKVIAEIPGEAAAPDQAISAPIPKFQPAPGLYYYTDSQGNLRPIYPPMLMPDQNIENAGYSGE